MNVHQCSCLALYLDILRVLLVYILYSLKCVRPHLLSLFPVAIVEHEGHSTISQKGNLLSFNVFTKTAVTGLLTLTVF